MGQWGEKGRKNSFSTHSTTCFIDPDAGSKGLTELSKVAVEQEGDCHVRRA